MNRSKKGYALLLGATAMLFSGLFYTPAVEAGRLKAKIALTQAKIPKKLTEKGLLKFARRHGSRKLMETNDKDIKKRKWKANMVVAFNAPVGDMEFQVLFYDIHDGPRRFVEDMTNFVNDRKQKTFVTTISLPRSRFKPNRHMELVVTVRRAEVGKYKFNVMGQAIKRSGVVSFGDDER